MKFVALLPVRDEADIIGASLACLLTWADEIYIFDTGSTDDTWEIVRDCAATDKRILPLGKEAVFFSEPRVRGWMFHQARQRMRDGDWFLRVDADEFHHIPAPEFVKRCMTKYESVVYHQYYDFRLTKSEVDRWERGEETLADRSKPIDNRRRYYTISTYSEPRLCRYRSTMQWPQTVSFPFNAGFVARKRLPIRHYPHRDPLQLQRRCRLRAIVMADSENRENWTDPEGHHWSQSDWRQLITPDDLPGLNFWKPGTELPVIHQTNHLRPRHIRVAQRLIHTFALPLFDRSRPAFNPDVRPQPIPPDICVQLDQELV